MWPRLARRGIPVGAFCLNHMSCASMWPRLARRGIAWRDIDNIEALWLQCGRVSLDAESAECARHSPRRLRFNVAASRSTRNLQAEGWAGERYHASMWPRLARRGIPGLPSRVPRCARLQCGRVSLDAESSAL